MLNFAYAKLRARAGLGTNACASATNPFLTLLTKVLTVSFDSVLRRLSSRLAVVKELFPSNRVIPNAGIVHDFNIECNYVLNSFLDFLFPKKCVSCGKFGSYLCLDCQQKIKRLQFPICPMCERQAVDGVTHPGCQTLYSLDGLISLYRYDGPVKASIKRLKYKPYLSELVGILLIFILDSIKSNKTLFHGFAVLPVPLHPQRERERGFNQASLLGNAVAQKLGLRFDDHVLRRVRNTKPQVELKGDERRKNLVNAFAISPNILISLPAGRRVKYPNILLIDDVWTTGSTMRACANVLKRAGTEKVWAVTIAR